MASLLGDVLPDEWPPPGSACKAGQDKGPAHPAPTQVCSLQGSRPVSACIRCLCVRGATRQMQLALLTAERPASQAGLIHDAVRRMVMHVVGFAFNTCTVDCEAFADGPASQAGDVHGASHAAGPRADGLSCRLRVLSPARCARALLCACCRCAAYYITAARNSDLSGQCSSRVA